MALPYDIQYLIQRYGGTFGPEMAGFIQADLQYLFNAIGPGAGVTSFNTRTGAVTLTSGDVTTALTYTPQPTNANLTAFAGLTGAADKLPYFTGASALTLANFTAFGRAVVAITTLTAHGVMLANGASAPTALTLGTSGQVLTSQGAGADPQWATPASPGAGDVIGPASSTDGLPALFDGTTGKLLKNSKVTLTQPAAAATITIINNKTFTCNNTLTFTGTDATTLTFPGITCNLGYLEIPINSQSAAYPIVLADSGKCIFHPIGDNNARTFTIPSNASIPFPVGTAITFANLINTITIAITTDTMYLAGAGSTGSRTLAAYGMATALKVATTTWIISGTGLT